MKWTPGRRNPHDPWSRFRSYKWLVTRSLAQTVEAVGHHARGRILDVGCGDKRFAHYCRSNATQYVGLDYPTTFLGDRGSVQVFGDALNLPFADGTFDTIVSFEVLEHVIDPRRMIAEITRALKPGGTVILTTPFLWGEHDQPHDYFRYTLSGLKRLFTEQRLDVMVQHRANGMWTVVGERICYALVPLYGRSLAWLHAAFSFAVLTTASLLEHLYPVATDYSGSVIVARKVVET